MDLKSNRDQLVEDILWFLREIQAQQGVDLFLKEEAARLEARIETVIATAVIE